MTPQVTPAELHAMKRDADRYRWWREQVKDHRRMVLAQAILWRCSSRREFDRVVDKERSTQPDEPK